MAIQEPFSARWKMSKTKLIETVGGIVQEELDRIAKEIETEMKAEAGKHKSTYRSPTNMAQASIHIENIGTGSVFGMGRFIGADAYFDDDGGTHLYYMTHGNKGNGSLGMIYPTRKKALKLKDGTLASYVRPYKGRNFIKDIADKYR